MRGTVRKNGKKWSLYNEKKQILFTGSTRISCFRYAYENNITITSYQHGGK